MDECGNETWGRRRTGDFRKPCSNSSGVPHRSKPILLIDDDRSFRQVLRLYLEKDGFTCKEADDGPEALFLLDGEFDVNVMISDYHMPVINELNFLQALPYRVKGQKVLVILMSDYMTKEIEHGAKQVGAFAFLANPCDFQELPALASQACKQWAPQRRPL